MNKKQCTKCKKVLLVKFFYKNIGGIYGVMSRCKNCDNRRHKVWRKNNPEKVREMSRLQRIRYPDKMRASVRKYAKEHPEVSRRGVRKWAEKNWNKISAHKKVYYALKVGKLKRKKCHCGKKAHAHHENYSKPLEVIWLCPIHHKERHMQLIKLNE